MSKHNFFAKIIKDMTMTKKLQQLIENIIKEEMSIEHYAIYCDMDGVLCDFDTSVLKWINETIKDVKDNFEELSQITPDNKNFQYKRFKLTKKLVNRHLGGKWNLKVTNLELPKVKDLMYFLLGSSKDFWASMPWAPGGKQLWDFIEPYEPKILSSPIGKKSEVGKREWCQRELGLSGDRVIITPDKGINTGNKVGILIDDRNKSLNQFHGMKIKYYTGNPGPAIKELKELGFK